MAELVRILLLIPTGYVAACLAAGFVVVAGIYDFGGAADFAMDGFAIGFAFVLAAYAGGLAIVPMGLAILLSELFGWRSLLFWAPFGGAIGLAARILAEAWGPGYAEGGLTLYVAAGCVAGSVYWLIAGRGAGVAIAKPESHR